MAACIVSCHHHPEMQAATLEQESTPAKIAGRWQMTMETPHGTVKGPFEITQDGAKTTAKFEAEMFGTLSGTGTVDSNKVSFSLTVPNGPQSFGFSGTVDGSKMSGQTEMGGAWSAAREGSSGASKNLLGTVTDFRVKSLELAIKGDDGRTQWVKFSSATDVLLAAPVEKTWATPRRRA